MAPGSPCSFIARSSSMTEAAGSFSGSVARAEKCFDRSRAILPRQSLTSVAHCTDSAGRSTCTPGVVNVITCLVIPSWSRMSCR